MDTLGGANIWRISAEDRAMHDQQFFQLKPVNGLISGDQARSLFMQSGLPSQALAQIWNLADLNHDGKMDKKEFSIAMQLIKSKLKGFSIPATLPEVMKIDPEPAIGTFGPGIMGTSVPAHPMAGHANVGMAPRPGMPVMPLATGMMPPVPGMYPAQHPRSAAAPVAAPARPQRPASAMAMSGHVDWSMSKEAKLKYSQQFNNLDKQRVGSLSGIQARNIMSSSGLPPAFLAQIWNLSDLDKDGKLTNDEFCIAMHLMEMVRAGETTLPATTPAELIPPSRQRTISSTSMGSLGDAAADGAAGKPGDEDMYAAMAAASFEDKRRMNYEKGQAELERRRQLLLEQDRHEREERERKEREEHERRERERLEIERRRQLEREKEMARQREMEQQKAEEYRKMMEQRDAARRELERQRQIDWEKQRIHELTVQRQHEQEAVCHLKQKQKNFSFQRQALNEKAAELNGQITEMRSAILSITSSIEQMKAERDRNLSDMQSFRQQVQQGRMTLMQCAQQKQRLLDTRKNMSTTESPISESYRQVMHSFHNKEMNMESLKQSLADVEKEVKMAQGNNEESNKELIAAKAEMEKLLSSYTQLSAQVQAKQQHVHSMLPQQQPLAGLIPSASNGVLGHIPGVGLEGNVGASDHSLINAEGSHTIVAFHALYEFSARAEDELSFQPGDLIQVFQDYPAQEGWLAGQIHDKVGWFPKDYAAPVYQNGAATEAENDSGWASGSRFVLDGIREESSEHASSSLENASAFSLSEHMRAAAESGQAASTEPARVITEVLPAASHETQPAPTTTTEGYLEGQALYSFKAKKDTHLTFNKGDVIRILEQQDMFWFGELADGTKGWFPRSYVKLISGPTRKRSSSRPQSPSTESQQPESDTKQFDDQNENKFVAIYSFPAAEAGDLEFNAGDVVTVIKSDGDWWTGRLANGSEGIFPANYVQPLGINTASLSNGIGTEQASTANNVDTLNTGLESISTAISAVEQSLHEESAAAAIENANDVVLRSAPATATKSEPISLSRRSSFTTSDSFEVCQAIAPFPAGATNQLSLNPGDLVRVRAKSPTGWWEGELQRKGQDKQVGWFPGNYVKVLGANRSSSSLSQTGSISYVGKRTSITSITSSGGDAPSNQNVVVALFDYAGQQDDELTFSNGDLIKVLEKVDADWWKGTLLSANSGVGEGHVGLFPANYVRPYQEQNTLPRKSSSFTFRQDDRKRSLQIVELLQTEQNYLDDLNLVKEVYFKPLEASGTCSPTEVSKLCVNWEELRSVSHNFIRDLRKLDPDTVGSNVLADLFFRHLKAFQAFVAFCQGQQSALDLLESKQKQDNSFRSAYAACSQNPSARGLSLSYFLLLPMTRVTKYPLVADKILKYSFVDSTVCAGTNAELRLKRLEDAAAALRNLCAEANRAANEVENNAMLVWAQEHITCEALKPKFCFASETRLCGFRTFLHAGIVYKAKSGRMLIALLFNDMLLLTTPDVPIEQPTSFKLSRTSGINLTLYKFPLLLCNCSLWGSVSALSANQPAAIDGKDVVLADDCSIFIRYQHASTNLPSEFTLNLRAVSGNARMLWSKQLEKAINRCKEHYSVAFNKSNVESCNITSSRSSAVANVRASTVSPVNHLSGIESGIGRLLVEIVCIRHLQIPPEIKNSQVSIYAQLMLCTQVVTAPLDDLSKSENVLTTQFVLESSSALAHLTLMVFAEQSYSPDVLLGSCDVALADLLRESVSKRGPILRQITLSADGFSGSSRCSLAADTSSHVIMKFVVQLFET